MSFLTRRFLFAAYKDIENLDFNDLDKICDRFFILIPESVKHIPFNLVKRLQKIGKGVKWIPVDESEGISLNLQLSFLLGKLHQKIPKDTEFAVLSDESMFDTLIHFVNNNGRNCVRVLSKNYARTEKGEGFSKIIAPSVPGSQPHDIKIKFSTQESNADEVKLRVTAQEIINRLVNSGNRPSEVNTLKQYVALYNQNTEPGVTDKIIHYMANNNDIEILDKSVVYHF